MALSFPAGALVGLLMVGHGWLGGRCHHGGAKTLSNGSPDASLNVEGQTPYVSFAAQDKESIIP